MPLRSLFIGLLLVATLVPGFAAAQSESGAAANPLDDRNKTKITEVERGVFLEAMAGPIMLFAPSAADGSDRSSGQAIGITAGIDVLERLQISLLALGLNLDTPLQFLSPTHMRGDFSTLVLGAMGEVGLIAISDTNKVKRFFVHARGGVGVGWTEPKGYYASSDTVALGGLGFTYFTRLRHFAAGLDVDLLRGMTNMGTGLMISGKLRYTF
jgi:hypothetical protein